MAHPPLASEVQDIAVDKTDDLRDEVKELIGNPLNVWAVAATIESMGIREVDAQKEYGFDSIFALAKHIYEDIKQDIREEQTSGVDPAEAERSGLDILEELRLLLAFYAKGLAFLLPMLSQIAAILIFRYSLWAWLDFNEAQATVVAFGTIVAFVVTGGFIQVLGRSVTQYIREENFALALQLANNIVPKAMGCIAGIALFFGFLNALIPFYPQSMVVLGLTYMILISLLLLGSGLLYAFERRLSILVITILGTLLVCLNMEVLKLGIYVSQWSALLMTSLLLFGYAYLWVWRQIRKSDQKLQKYTLPAPEVRFYVNYRYFVYGTLYFVFLFIDRILAWSTGATPPSYIIWFNTPYELGMDWAILSLVFSIAVLEYCVHRFSKMVLNRQKRTVFSELQAFNRYATKFYLRQLGIVLLVGVLAIAISYYAVSSLSVFSDQVPEIRDFFANPMTTNVFWMASLSYLFLNIGLLHVLFFFTLNKPSYALYSVVSALAVNFAVGFICSRVIAFEYATLGLLAGAVVFAVVSGLYAREFFHNLDYYYYSAF